MINRGIFTKSLNKYVRYSFIVTQRPQPKYRYKFEHAIGFKPHPNKIVYGGDDASFVSDNILAVADGVGAWTQGETEPSIYAMKLIKFVQKIYKNEKRATIQNPIYATQQAVKLVKTLGSSTLTIMTLHPQTGILRTYYIGDSVYGFFRKEDVQMATTQMVSFNKPYQLGYMARKVQEGYQNQYTLKQIGDDLIVLASDGLWDNLSLDRIHYEIKGPGSKYKNDLPKSLSEMAQSVTQLAYKYSLSSNYMSPIYKRALQKGVNYPKEGKVDDITMILARVAKVELLKGQDPFL